MAIWGKLGGAGLGFAIGGPLGALVGALAGHLALDAEGAAFAPDPQLAFTTGLIALAAKMARADGVVTRDEIAAFRRIVKADPADLPRIGKLFDLARQTPSGFEAYARQLARLFEKDRPLLEDVLDGLFLIAAADGAIHEAERRYLAEVARIFGFEDEQYRVIESRHVIVPDDPYVILGAGRDWDDERLRRHWRSLVAEYHPDRHIALGLPPEAAAIATARLGVINAAWDRIARERKIR